ncbi:MAG: addiction module protein [Pseudanabaena sp.]
MLKYLNSPCQKNCSYLEDLWDSIALNPEQIPVLVWHQEKLDTRKVFYLQNPDLVTSWDAVKERMRPQYNTTIRR